LLLPNYASTISGKGNKEVIEKYIKVKEERKILNSFGCLMFDFDALRSLPQGLHAEFSAITLVLREKKAAWFEVKTGTSLFRIAETAGCHLMPFSPMLS